MGVTIADLLRRGRRRLAASRLEPSPREAALLLSRVLDVPESRLFARPESPVAPASAERFADLLERRLRGEPVAYLLGEREFYGRRFRVDPRVLIPRPETEHLIETALGLTLPKAPRILDLATGSGAVAITLALERPKAAVVATDISPAALAVAADNGRRLGAAGRVTLVAADLAGGLDLAAFDLAVSNPPYVARRDAAELSPEILEHEPHRALFGGPDGTALLARLLDELVDLLPGTPLLLEIGRGQAERLAELAAASAFRLLAIRPDYAGIPRVARLERR